MLSLNTVGTTKKSPDRKRIGRGKGSGTGTYAGRGLKGQRSRSGGKGGLKLRGLKATFKAIPKKKGFTSPNKQRVAINLSTLDKQYKANATVRLPECKILGNGEISKALTVYAYSFSKNAQSKIEEQGGKTIACGKAS